MSTDQAPSPTRRERERALRTDLRRLLPGYRWTIARGQPDQQWLEATGTISRGYNRVSTMRVNVKDVPDIGPWFEVSSSGHTGRGGNCAGRTLARAVRGLQQHYEAMAREYAALADHIIRSRVPCCPDDERAATPAATDPEINP